MQLLDRFNYFLECTSNLIFSGNLSPHRLGSFRRTHDPLNLSPDFLGTAHNSNRVHNSKFVQDFPMTSKLLTEKITLAGLRSSAERLEIPDFACDAEFGTNQSDICAPKTWKLVKKNQWIA